MRPAGATRRAVLATAAALAWRPARAAATDRAALLAHAEAALERGDTAAALDEFERAAMIVHAPDAELGSIRAALQAGEYRRALAFCAHTAGEHLEATEAGALYAWLLRAGGQPGIADRVLAETLARDPLATVPIAVREAFRAELPVASGVLLLAPHRMAPWPTAAAGTVPPPGSAHRSAGGAVLVGDGSLAIVPQAALPAPGRRLWLRNGLGETTEAVVRDGVPPALVAEGLALLDLRAPLATGEAGEVPEPFAGSPGHVLRFAPGGNAAWPWLAQGFLGSTDAANGQRRLGFAAGDATGAAVLDGSGRLAGIVVSPPPGGPAHWVPAARWGAALGLVPAEPRAAQRSLTPPDAVYETGLRRPLQLIGEDAPAV